MQNCPDTFGVFNQRTQFYDHNVQRPLKSWSYCITSNLVQKCILLFLLLRHRLILCDVCKMCRRFTMLEWASTDMDDGVINTIQSIFNRRVWLNKDNTWTTIECEYIHDILSCETNSKRLYFWSSNDSWYRIMANRITSDPKTVIHGNVYIILFLTRYFMSWIHKNSAKCNCRSLISPLSLRTVFPDLTMWRHHSWSVTSLERGILALWRHIRSCTCKLVKKRSSLVNNNCEYRFTA